MVFYYSSVKSSTYYKRFKYVISFTFFAYLTGIEVCCIAEQYNYMTLLFCFHLRFIFAAFGVCNYLRSRDNCLWSRRGIVTDSVV